MISERREAKEVAQIYKFWNEYAAAVKAESIERWMGLWCDDGIQKTPDEPPCFGKDQIRKQLLAKVNRYHTEMTISPEVVHVLGDQAYTHGTFTSVETGKNTVEHDVIIHQTNGYFLTILAKQQDGSWKIRIDCFSDNGPINEKRLALMGKEKY